MTIRAVRNLTFAAFMATLLVTSAATLRADPPPMPTYGQCDTDYNDQPWGFAGYVIDCWMYFECTDFDEPGVCAYDMVIDCDDWCWDATGGMGGAWDTVCEQTNGCYFKCSCGYYLVED
jgi:hypothetical protein